MLPSRRVAAAFICVFLLGAVAGWMISLSFEDSRFSKFLNRTNDPASLAQRIDKKLVHDYQLDADEQTRIAPITQDMAQKLYTLRRQFGTDVLATMDDAHQKIGAQMNPTQRAAYEKAVQERRQRAVSLLISDTPASPSPTH